MSASIRQRTRRAWLAAPAIVSTVLSAVLTVAVVALWLGSVMPVFLAIVIGLAFDAAWLCAQAYERRLARQGDHDVRVTLVGWAFGLVATGMLVTHALTAPSGTAAWLAVAWLPVGAKSLWWLHSLWERTEISPRALAEIAQVLQDSRDNAAKARASLNARTSVEVVRMTALSEAGARVAKAQAKSAARLSNAWSGLDTTGQEHGRALEEVAAPAAPLWELPMWTPVAALRPAPAGDGAGVRSEAAPQQVSARAQTAGLRPEDQRVPEQGKAPSIASLAREAVAQGVTDPKAAVPWVTSRAGRPVSEATVKREIRNAKSSSAKPSVGFGFTGGN
ncbi:protein spdB [Kitasatospora sp. NPDC093550]|uniref:protein spdB n=1 Tax=Kitasatospora sp. NPDC093550 TaxID=3364089 RepID=UPI0037FF7E89